MAFWRNGSSEKFLIAGMLRGSAQEHEEAKRIASKVEEDNRACFETILAVLRLAGGKPCEDAWLELVREGEDWFSAMRTVMDCRDQVPAIPVDNILPFRRRNIPRDVHVSFDSYR